MYSHIMLGANNMEQSKQFYDAILAVLGHKAAVIDEKGRCFYLSKSGVFSLTKPIDGEAATPANGGTIGFSATSSDLVDEWHKAGLDNGGTDCEDPPGVREGNNGKLYLAYLRDPSGNKICAMHRIAD